MYIISKKCVSSPKYSKGITSFKIWHADKKDTECY
jgi:hypothetical protein